MKNWNLRWSKSDPANTVNITGKDLYNCVKLFKNIDIIKEISLLENIPEEVLRNLLKQEIRKEKLTKIHDSNLSKK